MLIKRRAYATSDFSRGLALLLECIRFMVGKISHRDRTNAFPSDVTLVLYSIIVDVALVVGIPCAG